MRKLFPEVAAEKAAKGQNQALHKQDLDNEWLLGALGSLVASAAAIFKSAATRTLLASSLTRGDLGYTTGSFKNVFFKADSGASERPLGLLRTSTTSELDSLALTGEAGTSADTNGMYFYNGVERVRLDALKTAANKTALNAVLLDGQLGHAAGRMYAKVGGQTICITHLE